MSREFSLPSLRNQFDYRLFVVKSMFLSEVRPIKTPLTALLALVLGLLAAQNESAGTNPSDHSPGHGTGYVYMNFTVDSGGDGLLPYFNDPVTRGAVILYLEKIVGDPRLSSALVTSADRYDLDPALVVSLAWQESRFNPWATGKNTNASIDRGLMQLNSSTFPHLSPDQFYDPRLNAELGSAYLRESLDRAGNTVAALAMYNAGPNRVGLMGAPRSTLDYISNIMEFRDELVDGFRKDHLSGGLLVTRDIKPVKDPNLL